jgi:hypothetical protein
MYYNLFNHSHTLTQGESNLILFLVTALTIFLCVERDGGHILNNSHLWHSADAANRILFGSYISILNFHSLCFLPLFLSCYWLGFDMGLNIKRKLPLLYVGRTAWMDTLIKGSELMLIFKIISMTISIIIFIICL